MVSHAGSYPCRAELTLDRFPDLPPLVAPFTITIDCLVRDLIADPVAAQEYRVYMQAEIFDANPFSVQQPACGYGINYEFEIFDPLTGLYSPLPDFITHDGGFNFSVFSEDPGVVGEYQIAVRGTVDGGDGYSEEYQIALTVVDVCALDTVSATGSIGD